MTVLRKRGRTALTVRTGCGSVRSAFGGSGGAKGCVLGDSAWWVTPRGTDERVSEAVGHSTRGACPHRDRWTRRPRASRRAARRPRETRMTQSAVPPDDQCRPGEPGQLLNQHLPLAEGSDHGAQARQRRLQESGLASGLVLLDQPGSGRPPWTPEQQHRSGTRPQGGSWATPADGDRQLPDPGKRWTTRAGLTARPRPALSTRHEAVIRSGSDSASCRAASPPRELPATAARSSPTASMNRARRAGA
jgi:hypothetical protein